MNSHNDDSSAAIGLIAGVIVITYLLAVLFPADLDPVVTATPDRRNCHSDYPTVCLPRDAEDVDCIGLGLSDFKALTHDEYFLDGDGDGIACESSPRRR